MHFCKCSECGITKTKFVKRGNQKSSHKLGAMKSGVKEEMVSLINFLKRPGQQKDYLMFRKLLGI